MSTISDVARKAGVSPATVSRVIQGAKNVKPSTREKVERAIEELGYVPSAVAQSLRSKRTRSLALVVSDVTNPFWTTVARGVEDVAQRHGYSVLLCNTDESLTKQLQYLDFLIRQQVEGVIIAPYDSDAGKLDKLRRRSIPTVVIDRRIDGWDTDSVSGDSLSGSRAVVRHLIRLGHERIAVISGPATTSTAEDRVVGYCMALQEASIAPDPLLIKRGEYRVSSGEELTHQLLDNGLNPTAIFAANNAIAMGVMDALEERGLRIPQDIALVSFDDVPDASRLFPFLTVVTQPVYDMGVNAAQLLLSQLESEVRLRPRHVVLPVRLIVRHSCGSRLTESGECPLSLPLPKSARGHHTFIRSLTPQERENLSQGLAGAHAALPGEQGRMADYDRSDVNRLLGALQYQEVDRVPHLELRVTSKSVFEYVLERELEEYLPGSRNGEQAITPEDHLDFATRLGMDAVPCSFFWWPTSCDPADMEHPPSLAEWLSLLERYLRAAQGTKVGIIASLSSFLDVALRATQSLEKNTEERDRRAFLEGMMDRVLEYQERVMRVVCDRFGADLVLVAISDDMAKASGERIPATSLRAFQIRMERLIAPAKEHDIPLLFRTGGMVDQILPLLHDIGFNAVHAASFPAVDLVKLKNQWKSRLAFLGNVPVELLVHGSEGEIEEAVQESCVNLAPGGGYVLASSGRIAGGVPPENFVAMVRAVHRYGRYASLGAEVGSPSVEWPCAGAGLHVKSKAPENVVDGTNPPAQPGTRESA